MLMLISLSTRQEAFCISAWKIYANRPKVIFFEKYKNSWNVKKTAHVCENNLVFISIGWKKN